MTFKQMILRTAAVSGILLAVPATAPAPFSMATVAQADTNISVNFGLGSFYDRLQPYGSWVSYQDQYVFLPRHVNRGWRPYTRGHWSFTRQYGWLWVSNEKFGWATYHYGRWGYSRDIGWYWVPGRRWAPAWVAWSRSGNEVAWAPLPPRRGNDAEVSITIGNVPDYYWQAVPVSAFLSINLSDKVIRDRNQVRTIVQQSAPETVRIENNIVVNNVIQVNDIEKATNTKVKVLKEKAVNTPDAVGKTDANSVAIFNPDVKVDANAQPKKTRKVEEVVIERKAQGIQPADVPSEQPVAPAPTLDKNGKPIAPADQSAVPAQTLDKNGKPIAPVDQPAAKVQVPADSKATTDVPVIKQDKNASDPLKPADNGTPKVDAQGKVNVNKSKQAQPAVTEPPAAVAPVVEAPVAKPKKDKAIIAPPVDTGNAITDAPVDNSKKKKDAGSSDQPAVDSNAAAPADAQKPPVSKKPEKGKAACDPQVEVCPAAP